MTILFVSDLHLESDRPEIGEQFLDFLGTAAPAADTLYILGDLFEAWVGDDDPNLHYRDIKAAIRTLVDEGTPTFFMHGNRDFMVGDKFASETGVNILEDPYILDINGELVMLSHGDAFCTDDIEYQSVRKMTRDPAWQAMMMQKPLDERLAFAAQARAASMAHGDAIKEEITDVNDAAVEQAMVAAGVKTLLHGHTHRPNIHQLRINDTAATRIVLGDWYQQGSMVRWDESGPALTAMPR